MLGLGRVCLACALFAGCAPRAANAVAAPTVEVAVRPASGEPIVTTAGDARDDGRSAGDAVEVEWNGSWWPAVLLERRGSAWLIHYDGYDDAWDEVVEAERIRDRRPKDPDDEPVMLPDDEDAP